MSVLEGAGPTSDGAQQSFGITASQLPQTVNFTSTAPTDAAMAGQTYTPTAEASSGLTKFTFRVDPSSSSVCAISAITKAVNFIGVGTCELHADQAGNADWLPAQQATQGV